MFLHNSRKLQQAQNMSMTFKKYYWIILLSYSRLVHMFWKKMWDNMYDPKSLKNSGRLNCRWHLGNVKHYANRCSMRCPCMIIWWGPSAWNERCCFGKLTLVALEFSLGQQHLWAENFSGKFLCAHLMTSIASQDGNMCRAWRLTDLRCTLLF